MQAAFKRIRKNAADIEQNSAEINDMIEKIIMGLAAKSAIALVAEDFEYIDKAFDCIKHLLGEKAFSTAQTSYS